MVTAGTHTDWYSKKTRMPSLNCATTLVSPSKSKCILGENQSVTNLPNTCPENFHLTNISGTGGVNAFPVHKIGSKLGPYLNIVKYPPIGLTRGQSLTTHFYDRCSPKLKLHRQESRLTCSVAAHSVILTEMNDTKIKNLNYSATSTANNGTQQRLILFNHPRIPIVAVQVNFKNIFGLVDTGSSSCLLTSTLFHIMYDNQPPPLQSISTAFIDCQGKNLEILGLLKNANIRLGPLAIQHDIIIFKSKARDFLIGFDLLKKYQITITPKGLLWGDKNRQEVRIAMKTNALDSLIQLYPSQKYTLMENEQRMITVQAVIDNTEYTLEELLSNAWSCSSEHFQSDTDFEDLCIFFQYVYFNQDGRTNLLYKNMKHKICCLAPDKPVAVAELVQICSQAPDSPNSQSKCLVDKFGMFANSRLDHAQVDRNCNKIRGPKGSILAPKLTSHNQEICHLVNPFHEICQIARQFDSATEQDIADRLSKIEQSFDTTHINIADINCQSTDPLHKKFITSLVLQYKKLFSRHSWDVGRLNASEISLQVKSGVHPIAERSFPVPAKYMASARKLVQRMVDMGVIIEGESPWESPLIFVKKKPPEKKQEHGKVGLQAASLQGTITEDHLRLIYDARSLNKVIRKTYTAFRLPKCQDLIYYFRNNKFAAVCDITAAFFTHVLSKNTMKLFSFSFDDKKYLYQRLPMGFIGSTNLFQAHISKVLQENGLHRYQTYPDGSQEGAAAYLDNVLIFARTEKTYKILLQKFFEAMSKANYRLKLLKCHFFLVRNFVIFGMELSLPFSTIQPEKKKVEQILSIPIPSSRRKCRSFIGSASYFSKLCPKLQVIMGPLYELTSEKNRFLWTQKHTDAFQATKRALARYPMIHLFDPSQPLIIYTDSCVREYAAYIGYQKDKHTNSLVPVIVGSHRFTTSESHYSQYQCELYSLVLFTTKHYHLIYGSQLYFLSDCKSLQFGVKFKELNSTILRWWLLLSTLDFTIIFTPATDCLLHLTDLLTRRNNTIKKTNKRLTEQDISKLQFIDFFNMPPLTLREIELICKKFNQWIDSKHQKHIPSTPAKVTSKKSQNDKPNHCSKTHPFATVVHKVTTTTSDKDTPTVFHTQNIAPIQPSTPAKVTSMKSNAIFSTEICHHPNGKKIPNFEATIVNPAIGARLSSFGAASNKNGAKPVDNSNRGSANNHMGTATMCKRVHQEVCFPEIPMISFMVHQQCVTISPDLKVTDNAVSNNDQFASMEYIFNQDHIIPNLQLYLPNTSLAELIKYQSLDSKLNAILRNVEKQHSTQYAVLKGILCIQTDISLRNKNVKVFKIMCPKSLVQRLFQANHIHGSLHLGYRKMMQYLNQAWQVPSPKNCYTAFIENCQHCLINIKNPVRKIPPGVSLYTKPRQTISLDVCTIQTNFPKYNSFLCIVDIFSLFVCAIPCDKNLSALEAAKLYYSHFYQCWGPATYILRDNAKSFVGTDFNILLRLTGCLPVTITSYQSTANTAVEYLNKYITLSLRAMHQISPLKEEYMHFYLSLASQSWNSLPNTKTGFSPNFIMTGQSISPYKNRILPTRNMTLPVTNENFLNQVILFYEILFKVYLKAKHKHATAITNHTSQGQFSLGDYVLVQKAQLRNTGPGHKLRARFHKELFRIQKIGKVSAHLILICDKLQLQKIYKGHGFYLNQKIFKVQYTRLKKIKSPFQYLEALNGKINQLCAISQKATHVAKVFLSNAPFQSPTKVDPNLIQTLHCIGQTPILPASSCIKSQLKVQGLFTSQKLHEIPTYSCCWVKSCLIFSKKADTSSTNWSSRNFQWSKLNFEHFQKDPEKFNRLFKKLPPPYYYKCDNNNDNKFWKTNYFWDKKSSLSDSSISTSHLTVDCLRRDLILPATLHALPNHQLSGQNHHLINNNENASVVNDNNSNEDSDDNHDNDDHDNDNVYDKNKDDNDDDDDHDNDNVYDENKDDNHDNDDHDNDNVYDENKDNNHDNDDHDNDNVYNENIDDHDDHGNDDDDSDDDGQDYDIGLKAPSSPARKKDMHTPKKKKSLQLHNSSPHLRLPHSPLLHIEDVHVPPLQVSESLPEQGKGEAGTHTEVVGKCPGSTVTSKSKRKTLKLASTSTKMSLRKNPPKSEAFYRSYDC